MGFGNYDEEEHENRESQLNIDTTEETLNNQHKGEVTTKGGDDTDALLDQLNKIQAEKEHSD